MSRWRAARRLGLVGCGLAVSATAAMALEPFPGTVPGSEIGGGLSANFEPSGGAWHGRVDQLFLCGDDNTIARMSRDGSATTVWSLAGNWEGIAVADADSDLVYVVNENTAHIREFDFVVGAGARDFDLTTAPPGPDVLPLTAADVDALVDGGDGTGAESLTFVPDAGDPEGGRFLVGSQENGSIYFFRLSLSAGTSATYLGKVKTWPSGNNDLSGLEYDWVHGVLLAVWDAANVLRALTPAGAILHEWSLPAGSNDEEGLAYDGQSLFIAEDPAPASEVWRYDDFAPMSLLTIADASVGEGDTGSVEASFTVTLAPACLHQVTVHWATADGSATQPADYGAGAGDLSFAAGQTSQSVTVAVGGALLDELDETFVVTLSAATNAALGDGDASGAITDDDPLPSLSAANVEVCEGRTALLWLELDQPSGLEVSVSYQTEDGTATAGSDFASAAGVATIAAGLTRVAVAVATLDDAEQEGSETFAVALDSPANAVLLTPSVAVTLCDDGSCACVFADGFESGDGSAWSASEGRERRSR